MGERVAVPCPTCGGVIEVDHPHLGRETECPDCGETFHLISLDPVRLTYAFEADEEVANDPDAYPHAAEGGSD